MKKIILAIVFLAFVVKPAFAWEVRVPIVLAPNKIVTWQRASIVLGSAAVIYTAYKLGFVGWARKKLNTWKKASFGLASVGTAVVATKAALFGILTGSTRNKAIENLVDTPFDVYDNVCELQMVY